MKTTQASNTNKQPSTPATCGCVPCEVPSFCRVSYYTGKLLTTRDFCDEQRYHVDKLRLHQMALHGWGSVCGLKIKPHPYCPQLRIVVEAGLAIDGCGREVRLLEDVELLLPLPVEQPKVEPPCPEDQGKPADPSESNCDEPLVPPECENLWICLRYCEQPGQFTPAPFDECCGAGMPQKPNCISENYCLEISTKEPTCLKKIEEHNDCGCEDCWKLYQGMLDECKPGSCDCIPLAVIRDFTPGQPVTVEMIDNRTHRPFLPSVHRLDKVLRCVLTKLPRCHLTHIADFNWTHGDELRCHHFLNRFIGDDKGFDITFDNHVRREGLTARAYQAMIVHHPVEPDQPKRMEIAPAHVEILSPTQIRLHINAKYARRHLDGHNFDLFLTLNCNVVVDEHGTPVDGNLMARLEDDGSIYVVDAPTGDGVPGGLFESWIYVRSGESRPEAR